MTEETKNEFRSLKRDSIIMGIGTAIGWSLPDVACYIYNPSSRDIHNYVSSFVLSLTSGGVLPAIVYTWAGIHSIYDKIKPKKSLEQKAEGDKNEKNR